MPLPANITIQASLNGGAAQSGAIVANHGDVVQLSLADTTGVQIARWQLDDYPSGWPAPPGWDEVPDGRDAGKYRVITLNDDEPPAFTLPASTALWGKFMPSVEVNNGLRNGRPGSGLFDNRTAISIRSPRGQRGVAAGETTQFDTQRGATGELQETLRVLEDTIEGSVAAVKSAVRVGTLATLPAHTFDSGLNRMTASANGALTVDGVAVSPNDRVLVKDEAASHLQHGIYIVTQVGSAGTPWILTRATDWDASNEFEFGTSVLIVEGSQAGQSWYLSTSGTIVLNTTALAFARGGGTNLVAPTYAVLRSAVTVPAPPTTTAYTNGRAADADGGQGSWTWNPTDTRADDAGTILKPDDRSGAGRWNRTGITSVKPEWFGAFVSDDATDCTAAFQAAISAGVAAKLPIELPAGNYYRDMEAGGQITISGDVEIFGAGRNATRIRCGPDANSARSGATTGLLSTFESNVTLRGFLLKGPAETHGGDLGTKPTTGVSAVGTGGTPGSITLRDMRTERWSHSVRASAKPCTIYDCYLGSQRIAVLATDGCRLTVSYTDIDVSQFYATDPDSPGDSSTHCLYVNNGAHQSLYRVRFLKCESFGWHTYGGVGGVAEYCRATDCEWTSGCANGMITNTTCLTEVKGCRFDGVANGRSVQFGGNSRSLFTNCEFTGSPAQHLTSDPSVGQTHTTEFFSCLFRGTPSGSIYRNLAGGSVTKARFIGCTSELSRAPTDAEFQCTIAGGAMEFLDFIFNSQLQNTMSGSPTLTFAEVGGTGDTITRSAGSWATDGFYSGHTITVSGTTSNNFSNGDVASQSATVLTMGSRDLVDEVDSSVTVTTNITPVIKIQNGTLSMRRCTLKNGQTNINLNPASGNVVADIHDCIFEAILSNGNLINIQKSTSTLTLRASGNRYASDWSGNLSGSGTFVGDMQFARFRGADKASAATVVIGLGADTYRVTGTTDVATIETSPAALLPGVTGTIRLIAVSGFALLTTGNIVPRGGSKRRIKADEIISLTYDPTAAKWIEVGGEVLPSTGTAPSEAEGAGAGTGASTTVTGGDTAFKVALTTGTGAGTGTLTTLTLSRAIANPRAFLQALNANASGLRVRVATTGGASPTVVITADAAPADATLYEWDVVVVG